MTVPAGSIKHVYNGNGVTRNWDFTFPIYTDDGSDIKLYKTATDGTITEITSDYTVDVGASHVVYPTVASGLPLLATGEKITLLRSETLSQDSDWKNQGPFNAEGVESVADKIMMILQQLQEELSRAIKYAVDQTPTSDDTDAFISLLLGYKTDALAAKVAAEAAQVAAELAETHAETAETNAETAETNAEAAQGLAEAAQAAAEAAQAAAESARDTAITQAGIATTQAGLATTAKNDAVTAKNDAVTAKNAAETAETNAETAETNAETAETNAESAQAAAETARDQAAAYAASAAGIPIATAGGTVDAITADYAVDMTLSNLAICSFVAAGANTSTTPTFAPDGLTPHTITKKGGQALAAGDIAGAGFVAIVEYNLANTRWELLNPAVSGTDEKVKNVSGDASAGYLAEKLAALYPSLYQRDQKWALKTPYSTAANRYTILTPAKLSVDINGTVYFLTAQAEVDLSLEASWDTIAGTDYRTASNRAGKDFYIYACVPGSGSAPTIKLSANSTTPSGYSASTSRKIGGFHGLCVAVGTISGHTLTDFAVGDVLPASIWDLVHRPVSNPEGMVFSEGTNKWVDIYLASGTGSSTTSVYGGTISDTRNWSDFADDGAAVKKRMLEDDEFQAIAAGSNEETNITGSADPGTTGGHVDTASRRMISNIGVEDACGATNQWLRTQTYYPYGSTGYWGNLPGGKGSVYTTFSADPGATEVDNSDSGGDIKLLAGGYWGNGVGAGSRGRRATSYRWTTSTAFGCRFCAEPV